jgi:hypothetical protein
MFVRHNDFWTNNSGLYVDLMVIIAVCTSSTRRIPLYVTWIRIRGSEIIAWVPIQVRDEEIFSFNTKRKRKNTEVHSIISNRQKIKYFEKINF